MDPETEKNINEAIDWLQQTGGAIQDFAIEQTPLYCREVVAWELASNSVATALSAIAIISAVVWLKKATPAIVEAWEMADDAFHALFVPLINIALFTVGAVTLSGSLPQAIKAAVAPRMIIVEHLRSLKP